MAFLRLKQKVTTMTFLTLLSMESTCQSKSPMDFVISQIKKQSSSCILQLLLDDQEHGQVLLQSQQNRF